MITKRTTGTWTLLAASAALSIITAACSDDGGQSGGALSARVVSKLKSCGLVEMSGKFTLDDVDDPTDGERCEVECVLNANCADFGDIFCSDNFDESAALNACFDRCSPFERHACKSEVGSADTVDFCDGYTDCDDGSDEEDCPESAFVACDAEYSGDRVPTIAKCDGYEDCQDGEDERGCGDAGTFTCGDGRKLPDHFTCDGEEDCNDGSDERDCKTFACKDGVGTVPLAHVCDLDKDCDDGSDEEQGCLVLTCDVGGSEGIDDARSAPLMSQLKANKSPRARAAARRHAR